MSDFHLDDFIDELASALLAVRHQCQLDVKSRRRSAAGSTAVISDFPVSWQEVVPPQGVATLDLELGLRCQLEKYDQGDEGLGEWALRICTSPKAHRLTLSLRGQNPLQVQVSLDGHLLRCFEWQGQPVDEVACG